MEKPKKNRGGSIFGWLALVSIAAGAYFGLIVAPPDAFMGDVQRIMYLHIPSIIAAYLCFLIVFAGSCLYLWRGEKRDDILAHSAVEIGVLFTGLIMIEGSIWGKPTWGVWWTWDARLTLTALHFLIFVGYLMLRKLIEDEKRAAACGAVLGIIGVIDLFLIHMAVYWWPTLHQPPTFLRPDGVRGEKVHPSMRWVVYFNIMAFILLTLYLLSQRIRLSETEEDLKRARLQGGT